MKKQIIALATSVVFSAVGYSQDANPQLIPCTTFSGMELLFQQDPSAKIRFDAAQAQLLQERNFIIENQSTLKTAATVYTVPVVFHILHLNGPENVSDATVMSAVDQINKDYRKQGSDISSISPLYSSLYVDAEIQFALAKKDPTGKCTNGIIHHYDANTNWNQDSPNYSYSGSGTNRWPSNKYLNVYVVSCISSPSQNLVCPTASGTSFVGGYTWLPGTWGTNASQDAIVYRADQLVGLNARALSHEIGHWLDLSHTFGNTNNPGVSCGDDNVSDTPPTKGNFSTCPSSGGSNTCDISTNQNVQNFMDYSSCPKMFTQGQITDMRTALASSVSGRNTLVSTSNLIAVGLSGPLTCTPVADFNANKLVICKGQTVIYTDNSQTGGSGSINWNFQGGTPATSTATSVTVTYPSAGIYSVSLTATNGTGSNTLNKISYINAIDGYSGYSAPIAHSFEDGNFPNASNVINGNGGTLTWAINNSVGANSTSKSIYLNNISANTAGQLDIFETPIYNLAATTNISLSYWYAYAKKATTQADTFKLQYSLDCGGSWTNLIGFTPINTMATNSGGTTSSAFIPTAAQWKQTNIPSSLLNAINNKPSVKFRFYYRAGAGGANNIYFDEINLSGTVGLSELENEIGLVIYPNPTNGSSLVKLQTNINQVVSLVMTDMLGRVVEQAYHIEHTGNEINYTINKNALLATGVYLINIDVNNQRITKKLIIE